MENKNPLRSFHALKIDPKTLKALVFLFVMSFRILQVRNRERISIIIDGGDKRSRFLFIICDKRGRFLFIIQIGLGQQQSRNSILFTPFGRIKLELVAYDLPSICRKPLQIGLGQQKTSHLKQETKGHIFRGTTLINP